jgi:hypothetical protein
MLLGDAWWKGCRRGITVELLTECPAELKLLIHGSRFAAHTKRFLLRSPPFSLCDVTEPRLIERDEGGRGVGLRMSSKLEHLLLLSMWKT